MKLFVGICINGAMVLLILGLIAGSRGAGLRRAAAMLFAAAFVPAVFVGLLRAVGGSLISATAEHPFAVVAVVLAVSGAAYVALHLRNPKKTAAATRLKLKRPYTYTGSPDVISIIKEQLGRDE